MTDTPETPQEFWNSVLRDNKGQPSSMRLMSLISLLVAIALSIAAVYGMEGDPIHILYFLTAAFAPKAVQKFAERSK